MLCVLVLNETKQNEIKPSIEAAPESTQSIEENTPFGLLKSLFAFLHYNIVVAAFDYVVYTLVAENSNSFAIQKLVS